jgi:hypothetical protein
MTAKPRLAIRMIVMGGEYEELVGEYVYVDGCGL